MTDTTTAPRDHFPLFLGIACTALAVLTFLLAWQNRSLKAELAAALNAPPPGSLAVGDTLDAIDVVDATGNQSRLAFDGPGETLLLVFSSTCGACRETIPVWNRLLADSGSSPVHVVGIQTDFPRTAAEAATLSIPDLRFPVFGTAEAHAASLAKFPAIPTAALFDGKGAVKAIWVGVPTESQVSELRRAVAS